MINTTTYTTIKSRKSALKAFGIGSMFSVGEDTKTVKGEIQGYTTAILYMMPTDRICPASKAAGCRESCLVAAGRGKFNSVKTARANKSKLWESDKTTFFSALIHELQALYRKHGDSLVVRLNGTSDIAYEAHPFKYQGKVYTNIFALFPHIQFYDYTKRVARAKPVSHVPNYHLTLSYSEFRKSYALQVIRTAKAYKLNMATVFSTPPEKFNKWEILNGDTTDLRFLDKEGPNVVALKAKGPAKKDTTGFVIIAKE